jgi:murein DD-endopeptidase MepM/ murein hydrolase activator NlpD
MPSLRPRRRAPLAAGALVVLLMLTAATPARAGTDAPSPQVPVGSREEWAWPVREFRLERAFAAPAHRYGAGHRGIDLRGDPAAEVIAPAAGIVAFSGAVAGRGILTIDHGNGLVTTLEPVVSDLSAGDGVARGDPVATVGLGGHATSGALHFGVRLDGEYINPMLLLGDPPRAVLLPCC